MAATATPTKRRSAPKLFSVSGTSDGIKTTLSTPAETALGKASEILLALAAAPNVFPKAGDLARQLRQFVDDPTAEVESESET